MNWKNIYSGLFLLFTLLFFTVTVGSAQETGGGSADLEDEVSVSSNAQIIMDGGVVIEDEEDWLAESFDELGLGGEIGAEPLIPPDDNGEEVEVSSDAN